MATCSFAGCQKEEIVLVLVNEKLNKNDSAWCGEHLAAGRKRGEARGFTLNYAEGFNFDDDGREEEQSLAPPQEPEAIPSPPPPAPAPPEKKPRPRGEFVDVTSSLPISTPTNYERALVMNDLSGLSAAERLAYYKQTCESLELNPYTQPFGYMSTKDGRLILYAKKDCAEQLRMKHNVTVTILSKETIEGVYIVAIRASLPSGRSDEDIGATNVKGLFGDNLGNAMKKSITQAKRRVTLSICGLGMPDESEIDPSWAAPVPEDKPLKMVEKEPEMAKFSERVELIRKLHGAANEVGLDHNALSTLSHGWYGVGLGEADADRLEYFCQVVEDYKTRPDIKKQIDELLAKAPKLAKVKHSDETRA
jgi:hypothetical protein